MHSDPYYQFLCACLGSHKTQARTFSQHPGFDWERLFARASAEMVLPGLYAAVPEAPAEISDFLSAVESLSLERNQAIFDELETAVRLLNQAGIEPVLLKGAAYLIAAVYPDPGARHLIDIDLLVHEAQLHTAVQILIKSGFRPDETDRFGLFRHHHPPLRRPGGVAIELHHSLGLGKSAKLLQADEVIQQSVPFQLKRNEKQAISFRIPSPEHLITHLILHSQIQHPYNERIWPPLRGMCDLVLLQRRFSEAIDWKKIELRFAKYGQSGLLALHLFDVHEALGFELPSNIALTPISRLRLCRRKLLRHSPALRYFDPLYMFSSVLLRRLRLLRKIIKTHKGLNYLVKQLLTAGVYQRLWTDVLEGRSR